MDEAILVEDSALIQHFNTLIAERKYEKTPDTERVVYLAGDSVQGRIVRGTLQKDAKWKFEFVPGIGY